MKSRHLFAILVGAALIVWTLASCDLLSSVSIAQRVSDFQSDLNSNRANIYNDFHPTLTTQYNALKDPVTSGFNTAYPVPGPSYSLTIVDSSNTSAVIVLVNTGSSGAWTAPYYMQLSMATYNNNDWRIVTLSDSAINGSYTLRFS